MNKVRIANWSDLEDRSPTHALVANVDLVIVRFGDEVSVLYGRCLHRGALMADGFVRGDDLICGVHDWDYQFRTGVSSYNPKECLHKFSAWVEDGGSGWTRKRSRPGRERTRSPTTATPIRARFRTTRRSPSKPSQVHTVSCLGRIGEGGSPRAGCGHGRADQGAAESGRICSSSPPSWRGCHNWTTCRWEPIWWWAPRRPSRCIWTSRSSSRT